MRLQPQQLYKLGSGGSQTTHNHLGIDIKLADHIQIKFILGPIQNGEQELLLQKP